MIQLKAKLANNPTSTQNSTQWQARKIVSKDNDDRKSLVYCICCENVPLGIHSILLNSI